MPRRCCCRRASRVPAAPNRVIHWHAAMRWAAAAACAWATPNSSSSWTAPQTSRGLRCRRPAARLDRAPAPTAACCCDGPTWPAARAVCTFDFERLHAEPDLVVMTLLAGISVTLMREPAASTALACACGATPASPSICSNACNPLPTRPAPGVHDEQGRSFVAQLRARTSATCWRSSSTSTAPPRPRPCPSSTWTWCWAMARASPASRCGASAWVRMARTTWPWATPAR